MVLMLGCVITSRAADFEGWIHSVIKDGKNEVALSYAIKDQRMRVEMPAEKGGPMAAAILNTAKQEMTIVMAEEKMAMVMPLKQAVGKAEKEIEQANATWEKTGETKDILGYSCTKYIGTNNGERYEVWATDELGRFVGPGALNPMQRKKAGGWEQMLAGQNFFPLEMTGYDRKGKTSFTLTTKKVERKSLADSLFTVPEGYQTMNMGNMLGGMGGGGFNPFGK